jgi:AsmA protein
MDKRWLLIGALVLGVFLFVILLVPFVLNPDAFRPIVETQLTTALGREVTMGKLSLSLMHGSLVSNDIVIADDPSFSNVPFVQAKSLVVGIELLPFIYHHQVRITRLTIDAPSMQLIEHSNGKWNYSSLGRSASPAPSPGPTSLPDLIVGELQIVNGSALVSSIPSTAKPFEYSDINLTVQQLSLSKSFHFDLSAKLPGNGTVKLTGNAGPISQKDASQTPFQATLQIREFNPAASGLIDSGKGISMDNDIDAEIKSDGRKLSSSGKIKASRLQLAPNGSPAQEPVDIDYSIAEDLVTREGSVSAIDIHSGTATVHVNGSFKLAPEAMILNLRLAAPALPLEQLDRLLPVVGVRLPSGSSLQGGSLTADLGITGPATAATLSGPVQLENTRLAGFDLGSKIEGLNRLGGTGNVTEIRVLKANVNSSPQATRLTEIYGEMPQVGTASGEGTIAPSGEIDFHLTAKLNNSSVAGSLTNQAIDKANGVLGGILHPGAKPPAIGGRGFPLTITGTAGSPTLRANMSAILR